MKVVVEGTLAFDFTVLPRMPQLVPSRPMKRKWTMVVIRDPRKLFLPSKNHRLVTWTLFMKATTDSEELH